MVNGSRNSLNLGLALGFHVLVAGLAVWLILVLVLAEGGWGAGAVPNPLATIVFVLSIVLWLATPALMVRWRQTHALLLWLLPFLSVGLVLAMVLLADAA